MRKRIVSSLMALILVISLIPMAAFAAPNLSTSEDCISLIKAFEGFNANAYWDNTQWSIGYGTVSRAGATITVEAADTALRNELKKVDEAINKFDAAHGMNFTQAQHDALASFSFNCGTKWMDQSGRFRTAILEGTTGNDFLYAISLWANSGTTPEPGLLKRRMCEANLYLNGNYSSTMPSDYTYVIFSPNGGTAGSGGEDKMQGYLTGADVNIRVADPTKSGATFLGWFTSPSGGEQVSYLNSNLGGSTLYAHWNGGSSETVIATGTVKCETYVNVREGAGTGYKIFTRFSNNTKIEILEYQTVGGTKWGRTSAGWISMDYVTVTGTGTSSDGQIDWNGGADPDSSSSGSSTSNTGKVKSGTTLNVRKGAGTSYAKVKTISGGTSVTIYEEKTVNGVKWGRIGTNQWVCMSYIVMDSGSSNSGISWNGGEESKDDDNSGTSVNKTGKVSSSSGLNVRKGAGTNYARVDSLKSGAKVTIYEEKTVNGTKWGRIGTDRWVCMTYITVDGENGNNNSSSESESVEITGTVNTRTLNVRKNAGTGNALVGTLSSGTTVHIYETKTVSGTKWGRIGTDQWVCMTYIKTGSGSSSGDFSWS